MKVRLHNAENLRWDEVEHELAQGGRFVVYETCISFCVFSVRWPSPVFFLRGHESGWRRGLPYTFGTLVFGWWAIPWGLIYAPLALYTNLRGGRDVTALVVAQWPEEEDTPS